jgi:hypothetical protein
MRRHAPIEGGTMRRTIVVLMVVMLFAVGSSVASAKTRQSIAIRALIAQADWENIDEDTGAGEFGTAQFATAQGQTTVYFVKSTGELVQCQGADTPDDPSDDTFGFVGSLIQGQGPARLTVGKSYSSAVASGTVKADVVSIDECTGDGEVTTTTSIRLALDLSAIGPMVTQKSRTTIAIPKQLRSKTFVQSTARDAAGKLVVDGQSMDVGGVIGALSLRAMELTR